METATLKKARRTYSLLMPGRRDDDVEVFAFSPLKFYVEGTPEVDPFILSPGTWEALGKPRRITVTVKPA